MGNFYVLTCWGRMGLPWRIKSRRGFTQLLIYRPAPPRGPRCEGGRRRQHRTGGGPRPGQVHLRPAAPSPGPPPGGEEGGGGRTHDGGPRAAPARRGVVVGGEGGQRGRCSTGEVFPPSPRGPSSHRSGPGRPPPRRPRRPGRREEPGAAPPGRPAALPAPAVGSSCCTAASAGGGGGGRLREGG